MKLELKHLAPYLPFGLMFCSLPTKRFLESSGQTYAPTKLRSLSDGQMFLGKNERSTKIHNENVKPLLRTLPDLTKEIEHNGEKFIPMEQLSDMSSDYVSDGSPDYYYIYSKTQGDHWYQLTHDRIWAEPAFVMHYLFEWHFDVFGLIDSGLAIDINTLKK